MAKDFLAKNKHNRNVRQSKVDEYANAMVNGRWIEQTGESIKFDRQGNLIDGQHRLLALIQANLSIRFLVITHLEHEAFKVIDTNLSRSGGDILHIEGVKNGNTVAAAVKLFYSLSEGYSASSQQSRSNLKLDNFHMLEIYRKNPEYWQSWIEKSNNWCIEFSRVLSQSFLAGFSIYLDKSSKHTNKIDSFFDQLCVDGHSDNQTIKLLRRRLLDDRIKKNEKLTPTFKTVYIIKTWNAFVTEKEVKQLSHNPDTDETPKCI